MKSSVRFLTIKDITVYIHFTFIFFLIWILIIYIASGMQGLQLLWSMIFLTGLFTCIVLHEYGHAVVAGFFGISARKITLYPIGGIASIDKLPESPKQELLISLAGPVVSLCIGSLLVLFSPIRFTGEHIVSYSSIMNKSTILFNLGVANIILALFNLIPAFPLDGGRILRALLALRFNYIKATAIAASVGRVMAILIIIIGLITFNLLLSLIGIFIILFARAEESYLQIKSLLKGIRLKEVLMYDFDTIDARLTMNEAANVLQNNHRSYFIVMDNGQPVGTLNRMAVMKAVAEQDYGKRTGEVMNENIEHLDGEMMVEDMLDAFSGNEEKIYPVFDHDQFIGVVNFKHIIEYLLIHKAASNEYAKTKSLAGLV